MTTEFHIGDKVDWMGLEGEVNRIDHSGNPSALEVDFRSLAVGDCFNLSKSTILRFTIDGRRHKSHTQPSLKLIERPKKKKKITLYRYTYRDSSGGYRQSDWSNGVILKTSVTFMEIIIHTESKEIEVEE